MPFFPQERYQCGPAALATALAASGLEVTSEALVNDVYLPAREGSLQLELLSASRRRGRIPFPVTPSDEALIAELEAGHPVLILQNHGVESLPVWHYAVVVGYRADSQHWVLRSGRDKRHTESLRRFRRRWDLAERWGIVVLPPGELPAAISRGNVIDALVAAEPLLGAQAGLSAWSSAAGRWPQDPDLTFAAGNAARAAGAAYQARNFYQTAIALAPAHAAARNNLADLLLVHGCVEQALAVIAPALADATVEPKVARALTKTADALAAAGEGDCRLSE